MAGLLSSIFDTVQQSDIDLGVDPDASGGDGQPSSADAPSDDASAGNSGYPSGEGHGTAGEQQVGADGGLGLNVDAGFHTGGSFDTPDGTTHGWTNDQQVSLDTSTNALLNGTNNYEADHFGDA